MGVHMVKSGLFIAIMAQLEGNLEAISQKRIYLNINSGTKNAINQIVLLQKSNQILICPPINRRAAFLAELHSGIFHLNFIYYLNLSGKFSIKSSIISKQNGISIRMVGLVQFVF